MAILDHWHPILPSSSLKKNAVAGVRLGGTDLVLYRNSQNELGALIDHCPHRRMKLSLGKVYHDKLQCAYHGYRFDGTGRCALIPSLGAGSAIPPKAHVRAAHSVVERYGLVWLAPAEPLTPIIEVPEWDDPDFVIAPLPDQTWSAGAAQMVDNFLDLAHFPFVHLDTFGDPDDFEVPAYDVERSGLALVCDYVHSTKRLEDSMGAELFEVAPRRSTWWYVAPFSIRLRIEYPQENVVLTVLFFHQPVDATTTKLYCFDLRNDIADGHIWNLALLNRCALGDGGSSTELRVVDFHDIFTVPRTFLEALLARRQLPRLRLLPPYREHLSQAFARFFMRVGLPEPLERTW